MPDVNLSGEESELVAEACRRYGDDAVNAALAKGRNIPETEAQMIAGARRALGDDVVDRGLALGTVGPPALGVRRSASELSEPDPGPPIQQEPTWGQKLGGALKSGYREIGGDPSVPPGQDLLNILKNVGKKAVNAAAIGPLNKAAVKAMGFGEQEKAAVEQAKTEAGSAPARGADPAALADLLRRQPTTQVVGMTKGGFQPNTRGESAETQSKVLPEEWYQALDDFKMHGRAGAEGEAAYVAEQASLKASQAERQAAALQQQAQAEELALAGEDRARQAAEARISTALQEFEAAVPRAENYGTLFQGKDPGERMGGVIGSLLGIFGGALSGTPSKFTENLDKQLERRARAAEIGAQMAGQRVGFEQNAYARLEASLGSSRAARAAIRAIYTQQAQAEMEAEAQRLGVAIEHPQFQQAMAALKEKEMNYLRETASLVSQQARSDERYVPPRAIVAQTPAAATDLEGLLSKEDLEDLRKFEGELEKRGILQGEQAVNEMLQGISEMQKADPDAKRRIGLVLTANAPENWANAFGQLAATPGSQRFLMGYNLYLQSLGGKAITKQEGMRLGGAIGSGGNEALNVAGQIFSRKVTDGYRSLASGGWGRASRNYAVIRAANRAQGRGPFDFTRVDTPESRQEPPPVQR